jgi:vacuolar-type H+-ATPase subunit H
MKRSHDRSATDAVAKLDPWEPLRRAALADAHPQADRLRAEASDRGTAEIAAARERAAKLRDKTVAEARQTAEADAERMLSDARGEARELLLAARRDVYAGVMQDVARQASSHRSDYDAMTRHLIRDARRRLGEEVEIIDAPDGGIIARAPGRQIDYSLSSQVTRCLAQLDDEVAALWS